MRKLTIYKELFKTGQTGFVKHCTVVNTMQFHSLNWDLQSSGEVIIMLPLSNIYLISRPMSGNPRQSSILDSTPWILVQVLDSGCLSVELGFRIPIVSGIRGFLNPFAPGDFAENAF